MTHKDKEELFLKLLKSHKDQVYRVCWGFASHAFDVEDIFQEVMVNVWKGLQTFRSDAKISTWIYRVTVNTCIRWQKKSKRNLIADQELDNVNVSAISAAHEQVDQRIQDLRNAIQQFKKLDRSIMLLVMEGFSYEDIAEVTGLTATNVGARIHRAKTRLKNILNKSKS